MVVILGNFKEKNIEGWKERHFKGRTEYTFSRIDGKVALMAKSSSSASGLYKEIEINLEKTPHLNWEWRIENTLSGVNELAKSGDDYPARIYVIFKNTGLFSRARGLTYVWSNNQTIDTAWESPYTRNSIMIAVQSSTKNIRQWVVGRRNIRRDYQKYFGRDIKRASGIAIMTDTDNSGQSATAYYGNIFLSD